MSQPRVHFVYVSSEALRAVEQEFAAGISEELAGWDSTSSIGNPSKGAVNVTFFIYRRAHIMMSHGLADKNYLLRPDALGGLEINKYRLLCVPGPWMKRKLLGVGDLHLDADDIRVVGWPRLDRLRRHAVSPTWQDRSRRALRPLSKTRLLWAPTLADTDAGPALSSYPGLLPFEHRLRQLFDYDVSLHPSLRSGGPSTFQALLNADVVVADGGTLVYEAWALGKPVIFPSWLVGPGNRAKNVGSAEHHVYQERLGLHAENFDELVDMARSARTPGRAVDLFMADYLGAETAGRSNELIARAVVDVWKSRDLSIRSRIRLPT